MVQNSSHLPSWLIQTILNYSLIITNEPPRICIFEDFKKGKLFSMKTQFCIFALLLLIPQYDKETQQLTWKIAEGRGTPITQVT